MVEEEDGDGGGGNFIHYGGLDSMDKDIFLDIAYFFKGWFQDTVIAMLKGRGYHLEIGIATLIVRSLLTINEEGRLKIHDLVEEMGKHIIIQEFPNDPSKHSMLQNYEDIDIVLTQKKINGKFFTGTEATQSIVLDDNTALKLLILDGVKVPIRSYIPPLLRVLRWIECPMETVSFMDQYYELVEINLRYYGKGCLRIGSDRIWPKIRFNPHNFHRIGSDMISALFSAGSDPIPIRKCADRIGYRIYPHN
ncbi:hypothetical protein Ahy_A08g040994 [Arachis hypogaea]|uniref:Disease resistance protein Roq1-like winged-helix domain-containing protein n=1 Tax=Arachis hypogaea TaxID=3818 RepID=A0A445C1B5_ARAHY|nr:hypothetical protein Ahy_A08g040994 [Arachis hypogaea]